jgi:hypothetical protein
LDAVRSLPPSQCLASDDRALELVDDGLEVKLDPAGSQLPEHQLPLSSTLSDSKGARLNAYPLADHVGGQWQYPRDGDHPDQQDGATRHRDHEEKVRQGQKLSSVTVSPSHHEENAPAAATHYKHKDDRNGCHGEALPCCSGGSSQRQ